MRAAEIAHHVLFGVAAFLVSDDDATLPAKHRHAARHGPVVRKSPIPVQFDPIRKTSLDVIQSEWPLRVSRNLHTLPGAQIAMNLSALLA